jgi:hypothetical protein
MTTDLEQLYREALVWDAHAGVFPSPQVDLNLLDEWRQLGASYVSINVGFDVMNWQETLATLAAYRRWVMRLTKISTWSACTTPLGCGKCCSPTT